MEVHFTPDQEAHLLDEDARIRAAVREGVAQAEGGEFIDEEEMNSLFDEMLRS